MLLLSLEQVKICYQFIHFFFPDTSLHAGNVSPKRTRSDASDSSHATRGITNTDGSSDRSCLPQPSEAASTLFLRDYNNQSSLLLSRAAHDSVLPPHTLYGGLFGSVDEGSALALSAAHFPHFAAAFPTFCAPRFRTHMCPLQLGSLRQPFGPVPPT